MLYSAARLSTSHLLLITMISLLQIPSPAERLRGRHRGTSVNRSAASPGKPSRPVICGRSRSGHVLSACIRVPAEASPEATLLVSEAGGRAPADNSPQASALHHGTRRCSTTASDNNSDTMRPQWNNNRNYNSNNQITYPQMNHFHTTHTGFSPEGESVPHAQT